MDLFNHSHHWIEIDDGLLLWHPGFIAGPEADALFDTLSTSLNWRQLPVWMFGKLVDQPRLMDWYGDEPYSYSGLSLEAKTTPLILRALKERCEDACGFQFNSVLANLYRSGEDYMGWHKDNEAELGQQPVVASVSLGATRKFSFKHDITGKKIDFSLSHGDLLVMAGKTQQFWKHALPKTKRVHSPRINLTFRNIKRKAD
ncbi:alpha-ketoglutarate-dependent dioxygenase AlkB [Parasalinivibrio latis]|uniref:alpha-ketoglutarate-dependent dioxygenase AlkB family protein n=1 Tax=Parasalinivibrio latis TaxID=2952610 RepID=UPI0030DDFC15